MENASVISLQLLIITVIIYYSFQIVKFIIPYFRKAEEKRIEQIEQQVERLIEKMDKLIEKMDINAEKKLVINEKITKNEVKINDLQKRVGRIEEKNEK